MGRDSSSIEYSCEYEVDTTAKNSSSGIQGKFSLKIPYVDSRRSGNYFDFFLHWFVTAKWPITFRSVTSSSSKSNKNCTSFHYDELLYSDPSTLSWSLHTFNLNHEIIALCDYWTLWYLYLSFATNVTSMQESWSSNRHLYLSQPDLLKTLPWALCSPVWYTGSY